VDLKATLAATLPKELVEALLTAYGEIESNFVHRRWKASELDAGHFVEAVRRIIEHRLFRTYTPIGKSLSGFNDKLLLQYEQGTGDESYRILLPRILRAIYGIRNKRGVGHLGLISPNEMDATLILYNVKWVLAEILRLESGLTPAETQKAIEVVIERETPLLWKEGTLVRVTDKSVTARDQVLLLLYDTSPQSEEYLREQCEYKHVGNFRRILKRLHADKLIFFAPDAKCIIMPNGVAAAEAVLRRRQ
jgi:hypothetical protein